MREEFDSSLGEIRSAIGAVSQQLELLRPSAPPGGGPDHAGGVSEVMRRFDDKMNRKMHSLDASLLRRAGDGTRWGQAAGVAGEAVRHRRRKSAATGVGGVAAAALAAAAAAHRLAAALAAAAPRAAVPKV